MIKNRIAQIVFQTVYCTLAILGIIGSLGYFNQSFNADFYVYYTNLSNYICIGLMFVSLIQTIRKANKKDDDGLVSTAPTFKFLCVILIMVTFLVYNILLAKDSSAFDYFTSLSNLLMHLILPIMFILDWILFYKHGKVKWYYPLLSTIMPLVYVIFVLIRGAILNGATGTIIYPYFFLDVDKLGWGGFFTWLSILVMFFVLIGYILYFLDNIKLFKQKYKKLKEKRNNKKEIND